MVEDGIEGDVPQALTSLEQRAGFSGLREEWWVIGRDSLERYSAALEHRER